MSKTPEQIRDYFIDNFGIEIPIEKCTTYLTAYNTVARLTTVNLVRVVNQKLLEEVAGSEAEFEDASNNGETIDKHIIKAYYFRYFLKEHNKNKGWDISMEDITKEENVLEVEEENVQNEQEAMDNMPKENDELELKKNRIKQLLDNLGLEYQEEFFKQLDDLTLEELNNMSEVTFLTYIIDEKKMEFLDCKKGEQSKLRLMLNKIPTEYRDILVNYFFVGVKIESLRGFEDEDAFIGKLRELGVYIVNIDDSVLAIENMEDFEKVIRTQHDKIEICSGDRFELRGSLDNKKNVGKFLNKLKSEIENQEMEYDIDWDTPFYIDDDEIGESTKDKYQGNSVLGIVQEQYDEYLIPESDQEEYEEHLTPENDQEQPQETSEPEKTFPPIDVSKAKYNREVKTLNGEDISNEKDIMEALLIQNYKSYGKNAVIRSFEQYINNSGRISKVTIDNSTHEFDNEKTPDKALKILNAKYIETVLKNADKIDYNFDINPKARRLGEAIIAMYSKLKSENVKEEEITDKINEALTNLVVARNYEGFDTLYDNPQDKTINYIANNRELNSYSLAKKRHELEYLSSEDVIDIMVSSELDSIFEKEKELAEIENRHPEFEKTELEIIEEQYKKNNDNTQIGTYRRMKALWHEDKNTELDNARAQKTQLLMYAIQHKDDFKPALQVPENITNQGQAKIVDDAIKESIINFIKLKGEIDNLKKETADKKIKGESVENEENMLKSLMNVYFEMYSNEETSKLFSTYIAVNETIKKNEKEKSNPHENER